MSETNINFSNYSCIKRGRKIYSTSFSKKNSDRRWYQHDIDIIIYSDAFRKMQRKSQLFSINDPVCRTRLIHTFEVVRIAKEISEKLGLNSELAEGIALAHDLGNVAFGKAADKFLYNKTGKFFKHEEISKLMLEVASSRVLSAKYHDKAVSAIGDDIDLLHKISIKDYPYSINVYKHDKTIYYIGLSPELIDGVVKHGTKNIADTLEGQVVNYADNIAYLIQDINDFEVTGIFSDLEMERYKENISKLIDSDTNTEFPVSDIVSKSTSIRTAVLIERFVSYNLKKLKEDKLEKIHSNILNTEIPILEVEPIVKSVVDKCWDFKKEFYEHELIKVSNKESKSKIEQLWNILEKSTDFTEHNHSYMEFMKLLDTPIFNSYRIEKNIKSNNKWNNWKNACFIAHLTCDEINLIIDSYLSRNVNIDISLPKIQRKL